MADNWWTGAETRPNGAYGEALNPTTGSWETLGTMQSDDPFGDNNQIIGPQSAFKANASGNAWSGTLPKEYKPGFMDNFAWALPFAGFAGAGLASGAFSGGGAAAGMDAMGSGVWNTLGEGAYGATGLGEAAGASGVFNTLGEGAYGATGLGDAGAGVWNTLGEGAYGATGLDAGATLAGIEATGLGGLNGAGMDLASVAGAAGSVASPSFMSQVREMLQGLGNKGGGALKSLFGGEGGSGNNWSSPMALMSLASGLYGMSEADKMRKLSQMTMERSDPFASSRPMYVNRLNSLMNDPSSITKVPGYDAGLQAVERRMASQGFNGSGNMMTALNKYGGDFYNQEVNRLMQLSGANAAPGSGSAAGMQGYMNANDLASRSLASMGYGGRAATNAQNPAIAAFLKLLGL